MSDDADVTALTPGLALTERDAAIARLLTSPLFGITMSMLMQPSAATTGLETCALCENEPDALIRLRVRDLPVVICAAVCAVCRPKVDASDAELDRFEHMLLTKGSANAWR